MRYMLSQVDRLRYEARAAGVAVFALPLVVILVYFSLSLLVAFDIRQTGGSAASAHSDVARGLLFLIEFSLPPVAGFIAAQLAADNPAVELHLALPRGYPAVVAHRLLLYLIWSGLAAAAVTVATVAAGYWVAPQAAPLNELAWLAPLVWCSAAGAFLALLLRSAAAASAVIAALWLGELLFRAILFLPNGVLQKLYLFLTLATLPDGDVPDASYWLANRLTLIATAAVLLALVALLLRRNESLLGHEA